MPGWGRFETFLVGVLLLALRYFDVLNRSLFFPSSFPLKKSPSNSSTSNRRFFSFVWYELDYTSKLPIDANVSMFPLENNILLRLKRKILTRDY